MSAAAKAEPASERAFLLAGHSWLAVAEGGLLEAASRTLVVADLHLEKGSAFARRGSLVPPYDSGATLRLLDTMIARLAPKRVVCLGDSFHDDGGGGRLDPSDAAHLRRLQTGRDWLWIAGNHDPARPSAVGGDWADETTLQGVALRHEPKPGAGHAEIAGHLHPAARVHVRGRSVRCRCIVSDGRRAILPALGAYAGGLDLRHGAFDGLFIERDLIAYMLADEAVYPLALGSKRRLFRP